MSGTIIIKGESPFLFLDKWEISCIIMIEMNIDVVDSNISPEERRP